MDLDSALLRTLLVLADERHFGLAAARLGITQQGLSKRLARLEGKLSAPVVDRNPGHRLHLTALGQDILPMARAVVEATDRIAARTNAARRTTIDILGEYLAPHQWTREAARHGQLPIDVVTRPPESTAEHMIGVGTADFAFGRAGAVPRPWPPYLRHRLILLEPLALLCGPRHPWASRDHVTLGDLTGKELWFPLTGAPVEWRIYLVELCETFGIHLLSTGSTFGFHQWVDDIAAEHAPPSLVGEAMPLTHPSTRTIPILEPTPVFPWSLFWRETTSPHEAQALMAATGFPHQPARTQPDIWMPAADLLIEG